MVCHRHPSLYIPIMTPPSPVNCVIVVVDNVVVVLVDDFAGQLKW